MANRRIFFIFLFFLLIPFIFLGFKIISAYDLSSPSEIISNIGTYQDDLYIKYPHDIVIDTAGNIYISDNNNDRLMKYEVGTSNWITFGGPGQDLGQFNSPDGMDIDINGNIYAVDSSNFRIQKYNIGTTTWTSIDTSYPLNSITLDNTGNIYATDDFNDRILKYNIGTTTWTTIGAGGTGFSNFDNPQKIDTDSDGNVYVTDFYNKRIMKYDIGTTTWDVFGTGGTGSDALDWPHGLYIDNNDNIYISETGSNTRIRKCNIQSCSWTLITGEYGFGLGQLWGPKDIFVDTNNNLYIIDTNSGRFQKYNMDTHVWTKYGSSGDNPGEFHDPFGIDIDNQNNVFIADKMNHRIQKYDVGTSIWTIIGSIGSSIGQFDVPYDVAVDGDNNIYVADSGNDRIQKYNIGTSIWTIFGTQGTGPGQFYHGLKNVEVDSIGNIYTVEDFPFSGRIQKYDVGTSHWTILGTGGEGLGQFNYPNDIKVDSVGNIYIADSYNFRIQKYNIETSSWMTFGMDGINGVGPGKFSYPIGVDIDTDGNIFVADRGVYYTSESSVHKYDIGTSQWTKYFKSLGDNPGEFNEIGLIKFDNDGRLYAVDSKNHRVQRFSFNSSTPTPTPAYNSGDILINKIHPRGPNEWIELVNTTENPIDLTNWSIGFSNPSDDTYIISSGIIPKHGLFVINLTEHSDTLNNPYGTINLYSPSSIIIDSVTYGFGNVPTASQDDETVYRESVGSGIWMVDNLGLKGWFTSTDAPAPSTIDTGLGTSGVATNLGELTDFTSVTNLYFEKSGKGKIEFSSTLNLTDSNVVSWIQNLASKLDLSTQNQVGLDADAVKDLINTQATITMYNVNFNNPKILINGTDDYSSVVTNLTYNRDAHSLTFNVAHFTTFLAVEREQASNNNSSSSSPSTPSYYCNDKILNNPDLFQIKTDKGQATLYYTPTPNHTTGYAVLYGFKKGDERFGAITQTINNNQGVQSFTIRDLDPKKIYYFKVAGINNCDISNWSTWVPVQSNKRKTSTNTPPSLKTK